MRRLFHISNDASRNVTQLQKVVKLLAKANKELTVYDIAKNQKISVPTATKILQELISMKLVDAVGKKATDNGRRPSIYRLVHTRFYALSIEILLKRISISLVDLELETTAFLQNKKFLLENNNACFQQVLNLIHKCIKTAGIEEKYILGAGISITGRVNNKTGESFNYFNFLDESLGTAFSRHFNMPVFVDNDTRCVGRAENIIGKAKNVSNAIIINLSRGLGTSLIIDGKMVHGAMGFAGEFGHMQLGDENKICICGKTNCLGTEVSGYALEEQFKSILAEGGQSLLSGMKNNSIRYDAILDAALQGDAISIELLQKLGNKLGRALGNIVNLLNPELIIIGGKFAKLNSIITDSVKTGLAMTALSNPLKHCKIDYSELGPIAGLKGAGAFVFEQFGLID